jgi:multiple sugar transport system permease protein
LSSKRKRIQNVKSVVYHTFVILLGIVMIYPILWMIASSLKPDDEIFSNASSLIPSVINWDNYFRGWEGFGRTGFDVFFRNSVIVSGSVVIGTMFSSALVAFGFARLDFAYKKVLFAILMATVMLPMQVTLIPQYIIFHYLGWINTFYPLIIPAFFGGTPFFIFLMIQFIRGLTRELD